MFELDLTNYKGIATADGAVSMTVFGQTIALQTGDLSAHLLGNSQTGGVVTGAVDLVTGRQLLQVLPGDWNEDLPSSLCVWRLRMAETQKIILRGAVAFQRTVQQLDAIEVGAVGNAVDFRLELVVYCG